MHHNDVINFHVPRVALRMMFGPEGCAFGVNYTSGGRGEAFWCGELGGSSSNSGLLVYFLAAAAFFSLVLKILNGEISLHIA